MKQGTKREYETLRNTDIKPAGLFICDQDPWLTCSPDGIVITRSDGEDRHGLIEMKNLLHGKGITLNEAASKQSSFCLTLKNSELSLKRNHNYYHQCQMQLAVTGFQWLDIVVRTFNPHSLHIERILPDQAALWQKTMFPKLKCFLLQSHVARTCLPQI